MNPGIGAVKGNHQLDGLLDGSFHLSFPAYQQVIPARAREPLAGGRHKCQEVRKMGCSWG